MGQDAWSHQSVIHLCLKSAQEVPPSVSDPPRPRILAAEDDDMRSHRRLKILFCLAAATALLLAAQPGAADYLVTADGRLIETRGPWTVSGRKVLYTDLAGEVRTLDLSEVDLEGSKETTALRTGKPYVEPRQESQTAPEVTLRSAPPRISLFVDAFCPACSEARELLEELGAPFEVKDVSQDRRARKEYKKKAGHGGGMPVIDVDGTLVFRFRPQVVRQRVAELRTRQAGEAAELLQHSIGAMGGAEAISAVQSLGARAACTGPGGVFTTEVLSLKPDRTLMRQSSPGGVTELYVAGELGWSKDPASGETKPLSRAMRDVVRGHEFHLLLLDLDERFTDHRATGRTEADGRACLEVLMLDGYGLEAAACFDEKTHLPIALAYLPPPGTGTELIRITVEGWRRIDGVSYLAGFTLRQGEEVFTYRYEEIRPNSVEAELFEVPPEIQ